MRNVLRGIDPPEPAANKGHDPENDPPPQIFTYFWISATAATGDPDSSSGDEMSITTSGPDSIPTGSGSTTGGATATASSVEVDSSLDDTT